MTCVVLLGLTWVAALYREGVLLRPWKRYQRLYREQRVSRLENDLKKARLELAAAKNSPAYRRAQAAAAEAEAALRSGRLRGEVAALGRQLANEERRLDRAQKEFQILRSREQAAEYRLSRSGDPADRQELARFRASAAALERTIEVWASRRKTTAERLARIFRARDEARNFLSSFTTRAEELEGALQAAADEKIEVRQILVEETGRVDRCVSCHVAIDGSRPPGSGQPLTAHPGASIYIRFHPPDRFGCTLCHQGNGLAVSSFKKAHGETKFWPEPLLRGEWAQASCQRCHEELGNLHGAPRLAKGAALLDKYGCFGCHKIAGYEQKPKIAPPLSRVASKVSYAWVVRWLSDPRATQEHSRMPNFGFATDDIDAIADFLFSLSSEARSDELAAEPRWDLVEKGRGIYGEARCSLCHSLSGRGGTFAAAWAPDLSRAGSKLRRRWLRQWFENPRAYHPLSRMPRFRFTAEEREALIEFILSEGTDSEIEAEKQPVARPLARKSVDRGRRLIEEFGCTGCHDIVGLERVKKIGPELKVRALEDKVGAELSTIGSKPLELLDFGRTSIPRTRRDYLLTKLATPRVFREGLRMPNFRLPEEEREALVTLLLGFSSHEMPRSLVVPKSASRFEPGGAAGVLIRDLQCLTCHRINGTGGDYAPDLSVEGSRARRPWIESFLRRPDPIRPLLQQMPRFNLSAAETATLATFVSTSLRNPRLEDDSTLQNGDATRGARLYREKGCALCHQLDGKGGAVGPDLTLAPRRLEPAYVRSHLLDPRISQASAPEPRYRWSEQETADLTAFLVKEER